MNYHTDIEIDVVLAETRGLFDVVWAGGQSFEVDNADNKNRHEVMQVIEQLRSERDDARNNLKYEKSEHRLCHERADSLRDQITHSQKFITNERPIPAHKHQRNLIESEIEELQDTILTARIRIFDLEGQKLALTLKHAHGLG